MALFKITQKAIISNKNIEKSTVESGFQIDLGSED
jgi:hypothetical protein